MKVHVTSPISKVTGHISATLQIKASIADASNFTKRFSIKTVLVSIVQIFFEITFLTPEWLFVDIGLN